MVDEKDDTKTTNSPSEEEVPDELKGKVLVAKVGHEAKFVEVMAKTHQVAHGKLGWQGQAELIYELDVFEQMFERKPEGSTKEEQIAEIKSLLQQAFLQDIMDHAEWLTEEEANKRKASQEVLFGNKEG